MAAVVVVVKLNYYLMCALLGFSSFEIERRTTSADIATRRCREAMPYEFE